MKTIADNILEQMETTDRNIRELCVERYKGYARLRDGSERFTFSDGSALDVYKGVESETT